MGKIECIFAKNKYGYYAIPKICETDSVSKPIIAGGVHEQHTIKYILENRGTGAVIHAGAYFGDFLPALSGADRVVYAFEPGKIFYRCARITLDLNFADDEHKTTLYNYALSTRESEQQLLTLRTEDEAEGGASRIMENPDGVEPWRLETIRTVALDDIIPETHPISLIHLDIEGYEENALRGGARLIAKHKPILIIEMADDRTLDSDFYQQFIFEELGYRVERPLPRDVVLRAD